MIVKKVSFIVISCFSSHSKNYYILLQKQNSVIKWAGAGEQTWDLLVISNLFPLTLSLSNIGNPFLYFETLLFLWL
jgi:hypothetical protein